MSVAGEPAAMLVGLTEIVTVGAGVAAAETLNATDAAAAMIWELPPKLAVKASAPACDGVIEQEAVPAEVVVAVHEALPKVNVTGCPEIAAIGLAETSDSEATTVTGWLTVPPWGLGFKVRKLECLPAVHVTCAIFELNCVALAEAVAATTESLPACCAV